MFDVNQPFSRDQLILVSKLAMIAAVDRIESGMPTSCDWESRLTIAGSEKSAMTLTSHDEGCLATTGMNLACLYAQLTDDGTGIGDALQVSGFEKAVREWVELACRDKGDTVKARISQLGGRRTAYRNRVRSAVKAASNSGGWQIHEAYMNYPNCEELAVKYVDAMFNEYIQTANSPFSDVGAELGDGGYIAFPDSDGDIRRYDSHGNCEDVKNPGDDGYEEWRDLFADDALYYQPEGAGDEGSSIKSYQVYRHLANARAAHPNDDILSFNNDDVQQPKFLDLSNPEYGDPSNIPE